ncbi:MAG: DUF1559 domain-containing protein [Planctomycetaceae bacterium]
MTADKPKLYGAMRQPRRSAVFVWFVGASIVTLVVWANVAPYVNFLKLQSRRNQLVALRLAIHSYHDGFGCFPPAVVYDEAASPMHSWRVLILPFLAEYLGEEEAQVREDLIRYRFNEAWNSPHNAKLFQGTRIDGAFPYLAVVGDRTIWPRNGAVSLKDIADGTSRTMMVLELAESDVRFTEPRDVRLMGGSLILPKRDGTQETVAFNTRRFVALCDGSITHLPTSNESAAIPQEVIEMAITNDGRPEGPF